MGFELQKNLLLLPNVHWHPVEHYQGQGKGGLVGDSLWWEVYH